MFLFGFIRGTCGAREMFPKDLTKPLSHKNQKEMLMNEFSSIRNSTKIVFMNNKIFVILTE